MRYNALNELGGLFAVNTQIVPTDEVRGLKEWESCSSEVRRTECVGVLHGTHRKSEEWVAVVTVRKKKRT